MFNRMRDHPLSTFGQWPAVIIDMAKTSLKPEWVLVAIQDEDKVDKGFSFTSPRIVTRAYILKGYKSAIR